MTDLDTDAKRIEQWARDMSEMAKPAWWKLLARRDWRNHQQPIDYIDALTMSLKGEHDPLRILGITAMLEDS